MVSASADHGNAVADRSSAALPGAGRGRLRQEQTAARHGGELKPARAVQACVVGARRDGIGGASYAGGVPS
jgi:hypothetical protein